MSKLDELRAAKKAKAKPVKKGNLSTDEINSLRSMALEGKDDAEIGKILNRSPNQVKQYRINKLMIGADVPTYKVESQEHIKSLKERVEWKQLQEEFSGDELLMFQQMYADFKKDFDSDDLTRADEDRLFTMIKFSILIHRNLKDRNAVNKQIENLNIKKLELLKGDILDDKVRNIIENVDVQIASLNSSQTARTTEQKFFEQEKSSNFNQLNALKNQRADKISSRKQASYVNLLLELDSEDQRAEEGLKMELNRIAMYKEMQKLSELHTFMDGGVDRPLLTPETVRGKKIQ